MGYGVADTGVDFDFISTKEAHALLKSDKALFVDGRDPADFKISKIQTSYNFPANAMMFKPESLDKTLVQRCKDLIAKGKLVICVSDAGIPGIQNRGHVSRCRHIAQYLHELGVERESIRRLQGGINRWKRSGLDGIIGDMRRYYAGAVMTADQGELFISDHLDEEDDGDEEGPPALADQAGLDHDSQRAVMEAVAQPSAEVQAALQAEAPRPRPVVVTSPTVYRVLRGEVYKKASPEAEKIIKLDWSVDRLVRTTGELFIGASGGKWAELDTGCGEKRGWVYVEGPGFGPSTRKVVSEYLQA